MAGGKSHDLIESLGSTETSRSHANDENVHITREAKAGQIDIPVRQFAASRLNSFSKRGETKLLEANSHVGTHGGECGGGKWKT